MHLISNDCFLKEIEQRTEKGEKYRKNQEFFKKSYFKKKHYFKKNVTAFLHAFTKGQLTLSEYLLEVRDRL